MKNTQYHTHKFQLSLKISGTGYHFLCFLNLFIYKTGANTIYN